MSLETLLNDPDSELQVLINEQRPFGPLATEDYLTQPLLLPFMFRRVERLSNITEKRPALLIGRRGSGKTAYLHSMRSRSGTDFVPLVSWDWFQKVMREVQKGQIEFVEQAARRWRQIFRVVVVEAELAQQEGRPLDSKGVREGREYLEKALAAIRARWSEVDAASENVQAREDDDEKKFWEAKNDALKQKGKLLVLLIDSLEQYDLNKGGFELALQGLLKAVASFQAHYSRIDVQLCVPSELLHVFGELATNPLKDFQSKAFLKWKPRELLDIAAYRFNIFLHLHYPNEVDRLGFPHITEKRPYGEKLREIFASATVTNRCGRKEDTLRYILRHTQLLPRQFILMMNAIFSTNRGMSPASVLKIEPKAVVNAIRENEGYMVSEVLSAFKSVYPAAKRVLDSALPNLCIVSRKNDIDLVYRRHVRGMGIFGDYDGDGEFLRMLLELGVFGVVDSQDPEGDFNAQFQYNAPGIEMIRVGEHHQLCCHPIFSEIFGLERAKEVVTVNGMNAEKVRIVFPRGCDPTDADFGSD